MDLVDSKIDSTKVSSKASLWEQLETIWKSITTETVEKYMCDPEPQNQSHGSIFLN